TKVRSQLLTSYLVKSYNVKVTTENGEVFLIGLVTEREAKAAADIASRVSCVKRVTTAFKFIKYQPLVMTDATLATYYH
ncbi:BON domain-containing protein, partial [Escherichia coli]